MDDRPNEGVAWVVAIVIVTGLVILGFWLYGVGGPFEITGPATAPSLFPR